MKARKAIAMGLIAAMSVGVLAGCGGDKKEEGKETAHVIGLLKDLLKTVGVT